jgi:tetratricopeptide (TPR) repeat protein
MSDSASPSTPAASPIATGLPGRKLVRKAIGPKLRILFSVVLALLAIIGANSAYMAAITFLQWWTAQTYEDYFYQWMILVHIVVGCAIVLPFIIFGAIHIRNTKDRKIRRTVMIGYALFATCIVVLITGFLLMRSVLDLKNPVARSVIYWMHVGGPMLAAWLYGMHRLVGPRIRWKQGFVWALVAGATAAGMVIWQAQDPRQWNVRGPKDGEQYYFPSLARTSTGQFIDAEVLDMNQYCLDCHKDSHAEWSHSAHRFSSFNNPAYLASVAETRDVALKRDGNVQASRFCAGCHDPVPFFSGAFDDPNFDMLKHPTSQVGISCTVCHAITNVNSTLGNADYTIEEPIHYPFARSSNPVLKWINHQLVKAKPSFHKKTFLKPLHKTAEFCGACHKVHLPYELNHYKEWLRGQNHYDSWLLSGVSGHGTRSFYYPEKAQTNCNGCHMNLRPSEEFGSRYFDDSGKLTGHNHFFPSANSGINWLTNNDEMVKAHAEFLQGVVRVDLFGVREGGTLESPLTAPLRPQVPALKPGQSYLLETVIRTLKMGHHFTQGTTDSNEVWLQVLVTSAGQRIGSSGDMLPDNSVDPWSHFVNNFMLDRHGNRIDRRNAQDIFVPLYMHQIPPGAGQTVHYSVTLPEVLDGPVEVTVRLLYRKFDSIYMDFVDRKTKELGRPIRGHVDGQPYRNELPVLVLAEDKVVFPVEGTNDDIVNAAREIPEWQRWNDYGIGMLLKGKAELRQAAEAFRHVESLNRFDGPLNLARALFAEAGPGQLDEAAAALQRAAKFTDPPAPPWTLAWQSGLINRQQGRLAEAEENFRQALNYRTEQTAQKQFDFTQDYEVLNLLGQTIIDRAMQIRQPSSLFPREESADELAAKSKIDVRDGIRADERNDLRVERLREAQAIFERTLELDSENVDAHYNLSQIHQALDNWGKAEEHQALHEKYKIDDTARGEAVTIARRKYPAADFAAEAVVIYDLQRAQKTGSASVEPSVAQSFDRNVAPADVVESDNPAAGGGE